MELSRHTEQTKNMELWNHLNLKILCNAPAQLSTSNIKFNTPSKNSLLRAAAARVVVGNIERRFPRAAENTKQQVFRIDYSNCFVRIMGFPDGFRGSQPLLSLIHI